MNATVDNPLDERPKGSDGVEQMGHLVTGELDLSHGVALYLEDITVSFDGFKALNNLNLEINAGELRCIIGPNGAGKTTMMDVITGKTRPDAGTVFFGQAIDLTQMTEPEIADVGLAEADAFSEGRKLRVTKVPFSASAKALINDDPRGFVKIVSDPATGVVLGGSIVGQHAAELISVLAVAVTAGLKVTDIVESLLVHPALSESLADAAD